MATTNISKNAYVIMPVSATTSCTEQQWSDVYTEVFVPAFRECNYACQRATTSTGNLIKSIITELRSAWIVLADLTDRNSNVFYELGVRHSLSKRTILVAQNRSHIPSDLQGYWSLEYGTTLGQAAVFRKEIAGIIEKIDGDPDRSDSPVSDFLETEQYGVSRYLLRECVKKLSGLFTELTAIINVLERAASDARFIQLLPHICLDELLSSMYVDVGAPLLKRCYELHHNLRVLKADLTRDIAFMNQTRALASEILLQINHVRMQLKRGEFAEPSEISEMVWVPVAVDPQQIGQQNSNWHISTPADLSTFNPDDLQLDLDGPGQ